MKNKIPYGYCYCGCGGKTSISKQNHKEYGWIKGKPRKYIKTHAGFKKGKKNSNWNGGKIVNSEGRILILNPKHHRASAKGYVLRYVLLAEKALGKPLPKQAQVHHFDGDPSNDYLNLVICENQQYHRYLHQRKRAYNACGHANWLRCNYCKEYDEPKNMFTPQKGQSYHRDCKNKYEKNRLRIKRLQKKEV